MMSSIRHVLLLFISHLLVQALAELKLGECPDIYAMKSDFVNSSFDAAKLDGIWYEQAYIDIAQIAASCPVLNTSSTTDGRVTINFQVVYELPTGPHPFTIVELYTPDANRTDRGAYIKRADMPGGKLIEIPTVVVDITTDATGRYETLVMYSCRTSFGLPSLRELVIATRSKLPSKESITTLEERAKARGIEWGSNEVKYVDQSKCDDDHYNH